MTTDQRDWRLEAAIRSLVTERVASSVVADLAEFGADIHSGRGAIGLPRPVVAATVLVVLLAATFALMWSAGGPPLRPSALQVALAAANGAPLVQIADGPVYLRTTADGARFELILQRSTGDPLVLASIAEREPDGVTPSLSGYPVDCPPSTGLRQERYYIGHADQVFGSVFLTGIRGQTAGVSRKLYLIAVDGGSLPRGEWSFGIAAPWGLGGHGTGDIWAGNVAGQKGIVRSAAGCLYEDNAPSAAVSEAPAAVGPTPASGPSATSQSPWWLTTAVTTCDAPAAYRLPDGSQRLGSCTGLLVDPPAAVTVRVGDMVEVHMTESSPGGHPVYAVPTSTDAAILTLLSSSGNTTAAFRASAVGTAWLVSVGRCLDAATNIESISGTCPVLAVVVTQ